MSSFNQVTLIGNVGRDPEVRHTQAGKQVVTIALATTESWKDKDTGERKTNTQWHKVVIFNESLANVAATYVRKGSKISIQGKLTYRQYADKDGAQKTAAEVVLEQYSGNLVLLDSREQSAPPPQQKSLPKQKAPAWGDISDEIPF